jgi:hypothetical protein
VTELSKRRDIRNIYIPEGFREVWDKFLEICRREGSSGSDKIRDLITEYVRAHEPGNPQTRLDLILERGGPPSQPPSCSYCAKEARYVGYLKDGLFTPARPIYLCELHRNLCRAQSPFYGERRLDAPLETKGWVPKR